MPSTAKTLPGRIVDELGNLLLQPPVGGLGRVRLHGIRDKKRVAITYDDGPNAPSTSAILDVLAHHDVKATFFCVGVNSKEHPEVVRRAFREGHVIGNHSMRHSRVEGLKPFDTDHIDECDKLLADLIGARPMLYRAPWGWLAPWETLRLVRRGLTIVGWDVYTYDWQVPPPDGLAIASDAVRAVKPGSIVLLHDGIAGVTVADKPQTVRATVAMIERLRDLGYEFVTVAALLGVSAYEYGDAGDPTEIGGADAATGVGGNA
jgi:peptidoglycan/xylan/chitin deacetylase (PgdA/CDA1 family)